LLDEQFRSNEELYNFTNKNFVAIRVLVEDKGAHEFLRKINAMGRPSFLFMDANGVEIDRIIGYFRHPEYFLRRLKLANSGNENLKSLQNNLNNDPNNVLILYKIGMKYRDYSDFNEAIIYFNRILENRDDAVNQEVEYPGDLDNPINLYEFALRLTDEYEILLEEFPETRFSNRAYEKLSQDYMDGKDLAKASAFYDQAIKKYPENIKIHRFLITYAINSGSNINSAINSCEKVFGLSSNREISIVRKYAKLLSRKFNGLPIENILTEKYVEDNYDNPVKLFAYAYYWANKKKNLESALVAAERAVELEESGIHLDTRAVVLMRLGRYDEAIKTVERAIEIEGNQERYLNRLEKIKAEMEKKKDK